MLYERGWHPAYKRNWGFVQVRMAVILARRKPELEMYNLGGYLWMLKAGPGFWPYANGIARMFMGRARSILSGEEDSLLARVVRTVIKALRREELDDGEVEQLASSAAASFNENPESEDNLLAASLVSQIVPVKLCRDAVERALGKFGRDAEVLLGLRVPNANDAVRMLGVYAFDQPQVEVVDCASAKAHSRRKRRRKRKTGEEEAAGGNTGGAE